MPLCFRHYLTAVESGLVKVWHENKEDVVSAHMSDFCPLQIFIFQYHANTDKICTLKI